MKQEFISAVLRVSVPVIAMGIFTVASCTPEDCPCTDGNRTAEVNLTIGSSGTKTTGPENSRNEDMIASLDVFVFRDGILDSYVRFDNPSGNVISINTTTGMKTICVLANTGQKSYEGITDIASFRAQTVSLMEETPGGLSMYGEKEVMVEMQTDVDIDICRYAAKVGILSIKTDFTGGPFEGMPLEECRLYLTNAMGVKTIGGDDPADGPVVLNKGGLDESISQNTSWPGILSDEINTEIYDTPYNTAHYFYCYSNITDNIGECTMLVLEAKIGGNTYYYPVPLNQEGYGHDASCGHYGLQRNTMYTYGITITRPGSDDPAEPLVPGSIEMSVNIEDWDFVPYFEKIF